MFEQDIASVKTVIKNYFEGIFYGNVPMLSSAFHPECRLYGDINNEPYTKTLDEYLLGVQNRKSPHSLGEEFQMKILSVEILNNIAYAKLHTPMLGYNYYDYLSLKKSDNTWVIVNKLFTHIAQ